MARKTKKRGSTAKAVMERVEKVLDRIAPDVVKRLTTAEMQRDEAVRQLTFLIDKLAGLLTKDQLEAASICGVTPQAYALEYIEMMKPKLFPDMDTNIINWKSPSVLRPKTAG